MFLLTWGPKLTDRVIVDTYQELIRHPRWWDGTAFSREPLKVPHGWTFHWVAL